MRSHNINKQAAEAFFHSDRHKAWDTSFYQELTRSPQLPFGWSPAAIQPKIFSSILPSGDEGACIVLSLRVAPYAFPIQSPCPGALCLAELHLPGLKPVRTPVAILGSLGVCIYVPASRHWLISYSPVHLN